MALIINLTSMTEKEILQELKAIREVLFYLSFTGLIPGFEEQKQKKLELENKLKEIKK